MVLMIKPPLYTFVLTPHLTCAADKDKSFLPYYDILINYVR